MDTVSESNWIQSMSLGGVLGGGMDRGRTGLAQGLESGLLSDDRQTPAISFLSQENHDTRVST